MASIGTVPFGGRIHPIVPPSRSPMEQPLHHEHLRRSITMDHQSSNDPIPQKTPPILSPIYQTHSNLPPKLANARLTHPNSVELQQQQRRDSQDKKEAARIKSSNNTNLEINIPRSHPEAPLYPSPPAPQQSQLPPPPPPMMGVKQNVLSPLPSAPFPPIVQYHTWPQQSHPPPPPPVSVPAPASVPAPVSGPGPAPAPALGPNPHVMQQVYTNPPPLNSPHAISPHTVHPYPLPKFQYIPVQHQHQHQPHGYPGHGYPGHGYPGVPPQSFAMSSPQPQMPPPPPQYLQSVPPPPLYLTNPITTQAGPNNEQTMRSPPELDSSMPLSPSSSTYSTPQNSPETANPVPIEKNQYSDQTKQINLNIGSSSSSDMSKTQQPEGYVPLHTRGPGYSGRIGKQPVRDPRKLKHRVWLQQNRNYQDKLYHAGFRVLEGTNGAKVCSLCHKQFSKEMFVWRHALNHVDEKPFHCTVCEQKFTRSDTLQRHIRRAGHQGIASIAETN